MEVTQNSKEQEVLRILRKRLSALEQKIWRQRTKVDPSSPVALYRMEHAEYSAPDWNIVIYMFMIEIVSDPSYHMRFSTISKELRVLRKELQQWALNEQAAQLFSMKQRQGKWRREMFSDGSILPQEREESVCLSRQKVSKGASRK